jgi:uncharacterized glyoxalase superfamily protein PhnB
MLKNRSVPTDIILPHLVYQDVDAAVSWLTKTFGFKEHYRYGNPFDGAQMHLGNAWIMISRPKPGFSSPTKLGGATQSLTVFVENVEEHFSRTKAAGAKIVEDLHETVYGELQYGVRDLEGHHWLFSRHAQDVSPDAWEARLAEK